MPDAPSPLRAPIGAVAVFCGSREGAEPAFVRAAETLGESLAQRGIALVYGGGVIGLMGATARAVLRQGGRAIGVIPEFLQALELRQPNLSELVVVDGMHERKRCMFERADAFVILPGGLGTLDEAMEIITSKQLLRHEKPIVVVNLCGYWDALATLVDSVVAGGFADPRVRDLFVTVTAVESIFEAIESSPTPDPSVLTSHL